VLAGCWQKFDRSWVGWLASLLVVAPAVGDAVLAPAPAPRQPDFIDTVLASRAVVVSIRIAIIFAALFLVLSVSALISRRQWLSRVGPVEVEEVGDLQAENGGLEEWLADANDAIEVLEKTVAYTQQLIDQEER
jgi:hypothetical protein